MRDFPKPVYTIRITFDLSCWLGLDVGDTMEATREVRWTTTFWHVPALNKDVPDWAVEVL